MSCKGVTSVDDVEQRQTVGQGEKLLVATRRGDSSLSPAFSKRVVLTNIGDQAEILSEREEPFSIWTGGGELYQEWCRE